MSGKAGLVSALRGGWRLAWKNKRLWLIIWAAHVGGAAVLAWSFAGVWNQLLGNRLAATEFGGPATTSILVDLVSHHPAAVGRLLEEAGVGLPVTGRIGGLFLLYVGLGAALSGGILARLSRSMSAVIPAAGAGPAEFEVAARASERAAGSEATEVSELAVTSEASKPTDASEGAQERFLPAFLRDCGRYVGRFSRLLLVHAVIVAAVLFVVGAAVGRLLGSLLDFDDPALQTRGGLLLLATLTAVFLLLAMIFDYAKVRMVQERRRSALLAWWAGLRWALPRLPRTLGLHLGFVLVAVLVTVSYWLLAPGPTPLEGGTRVSLLLLQQGYLLFRAGLRVHWYAAELSLYGS